MQTEHDLTDSQKKAFEENEADFVELNKQMRSFGETASSRLATSGLHRDPNANDCLLCPCGQFQGAPGDKCTCGHQMTSHDGYY